MTQLFIEVPDGANPVPSEIWAGADSRYAYGALTGDTSYIPTDPSLAEEELSTEELDGLVVIGAIHGRLLSDLQEKGLIRPTPEAGLRP